MCRAYNRWLADSCKPCPAGCLASPCCRRSRYQDGFFPGAPQMPRDWLGPLSAEAKHRVLAGGAMGFYGLN